MAAALIPMSLKEWSPTKIVADLPAVTETNSTWKITSDHSAGGYFYELPKENPRTVISWQWKVDTFPSVTPRKPFDKASDDYPLRVGIVLTNGDDNIRVPPGIKTKELPKISYVAFYVASNLPEKECACDTSAYNKYILTCQVPVGKEITRVKKQPIEETARHFHLEGEKRALKALGIWIFADSDNSKSKSDATLGRLEME